MTYFESYQQTAFFDFPELEFPGVTDVADVHVVNYLSTRHYTLSVTVTDIDESVVVRLDGSLDGVTYGPLISNTITEDGTYLYYVTGAPVAYLRGNFLKETGGVRAIVKFNVAAN
jgi:hypothetical protein